MFVRSISRRCLNILGSTPRMFHNSSLYQGASHKYWVSEPNESITIQLAESGAGALPPKKVCDMFQECVDKYGDLPAVHYKHEMDGERDKEWTTLSWREFYGKCTAFGKSLVHIGIDPHKVINIVGFNSLAWLCANNGAILAGSIPAGIYTTNSSEACTYIGQHSEAELLVVEDNMQLEKYASSLSQLPHVKGIVMYRETPSQSLVQSLSRAVPVYSFDEFLSLGAELEDEVLAARTADITPGHCASVIYTSGTTGPPKAVMISHDNITWTAKVLNDEYTKASCRDRYVSYLPLSHISAQVMDIYGPMYLGASVFIAQPDALKGSLVDTLKEAKPTVFFGVPRVWEKMAEKMQMIGSTTTGLKKVVSAWAKQQALEHHMNRQFDSPRYGQSPPLFPLADKLVLSKVKEALGLQECYYFATGSAPISKDVLLYFASLNMPIYDVYGMSENTGPFCMAKDGAWKFGTAGRPLPGMATRIDPDTGELQFKGRNVFMGYMHSPDVTQSTIGEDGYLRTGDIASMSEDHDPLCPPPAGFITITGRLKELIITAGGENVAPLVIEAAMKTAMPALSNCVVEGDQRKFLSMLISLKCEVDPETNSPTDVLADQALLASREIGSSARTMTEASQDPLWHKYIEAGLEEANAHAISHAQRVQKWRMLPIDFSEKEGDLTPTLKVKRSVVRAKYKSLVDEMYEEDV